MPPIDDLPSPVKGASSIDDLPAPSDSEPDEGSSYAKSFMSGAVTLPFSHQLAAVGKTGADVLSGVTPPSEALDEYRSERDQLKNELDQNIAKNPTVALLGSLATAPLIPMSEGDLAEAGFKFGAASGLSNSKADLTRGEIGPALDDTLKGGAIGGVIGGTTEGVLSKNDILRNYLKNVSDKRYLNAWGPTGDSIKKVGADEFGNSREKFLGALRENTGFFSSPGDIAQNANKSLQASGGNIGELLNNRLSGAQVNRGVVLKDLEEQIAKLDQSDANTALVQRLKNEAENIRNRIATRGENIPIAEANKIKGDYASNVNWQSLNPNVIENNVNTYASDAFRRGVSSAANEINPETAELLQNEFQKYGPLKSVRDLAQKRQNQLDQSPQGGLLDVAASAGGGGIGALIGGPMGAAVGGASGLALKGLRPRFSSMQAVTANQALKGADWLNQLVKTNPQALGRWTLPLTRAANKGDHHLGMTDWLLQEKDQEYREHRKSLQDQDSNSND